jgi:choline kinase
VKSVSQALIIAGGFGKRMNGLNNPLHCKSLIEYGGQSMLGHLLDHLKEAGIDRIIIATSSHAFDAISLIVSKKNLKDVKVVVEDAGEFGFRRIPLKLKNYLDERFLMVCGHHPVSTLHIKNMIESPP